MYILLISLRPEKQFCKVCTVEFNDSHAVQVHIFRILYSFLMEKNTYEDFSVENETVDTSGIMISVLT